MTRDEILLKEYELCQNATQNIEQSMWATFAAFGIVSIAAFGLTIQYKFSIFPSIFIGALVVGSSFIWWSMARRWWSIQQIKYMRMHHIENILGMYQNNYVSYVDAYKQWKDSSRKDKKAPRVPIGLVSCAVSD